MTRIRLANSNDAPILAKLRYEFRTKTTDDVENRTEFISRCELWMREGLQKGNWRCWIAEGEQGIVGALWLQLIEKIPNPTSEAEYHAYITNVFVRETARQHGIGSRLLAEAIAFCREREVHAVILWPTDKSRSLYERHGFAVRDDLLELIVPDML